MERFSSIICACVVGLIVYIGVLALIASPLQVVYRDDPTITFAPSHFNDARQYIYICKAGYNLPSDIRLIDSRSRVNWMPIYALMQCILHRVGGVSLNWTGIIVSASAVVITLAFGILTLANLGVQFPALHTLAALASPIGAVWLYLPGVEATYLAIGMMILWLITLPPPNDTAKGRLVELGRVILGILLGVVFVLTKPNPLGLAIPFIFAFFYLSWRRSRAAGYKFGLYTFVADVVIDHIRPLIAVWRRIGNTSFEIEARPICYDWMPLAALAGILLGLSYWIAFTSNFSGVPLYFMRQQASWPRTWPFANVEEMVLYFAQAFRGVTASTPWRYNAAWYLAANLAALIPAASPRVPTLIRGMLWLMPVFMIVTGQAHGTDRYNLSTALVAIGWACWLAPIGQMKRWAILRWLFLIVLSIVTSYLLVWHMFPAHEPSATGILDF
jgi:hypothetical protein